MLTCFSVASWNLPTCVLFETILLEYKITSNRPSWLSTCYFSSHLRMILFKIVIFFSLSSSLFNYFQSFSNSCGISSRLAFFFQPSCVHVLSVTLKNSIWRDFILIPVAICFRFSPPTRTVIFCTMHESTLFILWYLLTTVAFCSHPHPFCSV